jgi:DegV family protein with EDD domain
LSEQNAKYLDGDALAAALTSGIHRVLADQEYLNCINVFPVADSDTGTNLSLSLGSALGLLGRPGEKHLGTMLAAVADALLDGARGNSGAIMAQFFQGVSDSAGEIARFTTYTFGKAVALGSEYAHDALSQPREGTILSVIAAFAENISHQVNTVREGEFPPLIDQAMQAAEEALANTPSQLDVLRKAGVVDAGAKGFVDLIAGVACYLKDGTITPLPDTSIAHEIEPAVDFAEADNESRYRYCTECIITGSDINRRKMREALGELGDSLVLAGTKRKAKVHIHVDDPEEVFETARQFGDLSAEKADDMHRQQHVQFLASHFNDVISIDLTSAASGTYEAARLAAARTNAPGKIHVVDSLNASLGQGQLAVLAAECAEADLDVQTTLAALREQVHVTTSYAILSDMRYAVRGGRLPKWVKTIASLLRLTPIIYTTHDGKVSLSGFLIGKHNRIERFAKYVAKRVPEGKVEIGIGHAICEADSYELEQQIRRLVPDIEKLVVTGLGPGIGVHGGPGTLLVAVRPWVSAQDIARRGD